ncbi:hypothetical protein Hanom_Chr05g00411711 [Helianthus anomalus]
MFSLQVEGTSLDFNPKIRKKSPLKNHHLHHCTAQCLPQFESRRKSPLKNTTYIIVQLFQLPTRGDCGS